MTPPPRFTPSLLDHPTLERLFVARTQVLDEFVTSARRAAISDDRSHKLLVGPRGSGKSHLITLVYYRIRQLEEFGQSIQVAWLPEDPWTISSLEEFAHAILSALEPHAQPATQNSLDQLVAVSRASGPIVVLAENLDLIFDAIGSAGQRRLRALLENDRPLLIVASSTRLTRHVLSQSEPFYGFFDSTTLQPFGLGEATEMLKAIALYNDDTELAEQLDTPSTQTKLATIQDLAGGQPRIWALLSAGMRVEGIDDLISSMLALLDDLTPYYQEQMRRLSPNQRKVVGALARSDRSLSVRGLSEATAIAQRSLAKTVTELSRAGWVEKRSGPLVAMADKRLSLYDLAEPLARTVFQLKEAHGQPVKTVIDFLVAWHTLELENKYYIAAEIRTNPYWAAAETQASQPEAEAYRWLAQLVPSPIWPFDPIGRHGPRRTDRKVGPVLRALDDGLRSYQSGDPQPLLEQSSALSRLLENRLSKSSASLLRANLAQLALWSTDETNNGWLARLDESLASSAETDRTTILLAIAMWHFRLGNDTAAELTIDQVIASGHPSGEIRSLWWADELASAASMLRASGLSHTALRLIRYIRPLITEPWLLLNIATQQQTLIEEQGGPTSAQDIIDEWRRTRNDIRAAANKLGVERWGPFDLHAGRELAKAYRRAGNSDAALDEYGSVIHGFLASDDPWMGYVLMRERAEVRMATGRFDDAAADYRDLHRALIQDPRRSVLASFLGSDETDYDLLMTDAPIEQHQALDAAKELATTLQALSG